MSSIIDGFAAAVSTVQRPTEFCVAGTQQSFAPGLSVEGIGPVALPLLAMQAELLIAAAERAPYGRGQDTLTDINVRRTWQIDAGRVHFESKHWTDTLQAVVARVAESLGVSDPIDAELYKLLIYDQASFFVPHRDTEKSPGMFATLVLALPSVSEGGVLIVRHGGREVRVDLRSGDPADVSFAAFYADCVHEVLPVTAGYRLVLIYNLLRRGRGRLPEAPNYDGEQDRVATILRQWIEAPEGEPLKLIYPLEHAYTPAELGFGSLKGADAGIAAVVVASAGRAGCDVHLALVTIEESGIAEYNGDWRRDHSDDDDDFEVVEVSDRTAVASHWRRPDGAVSPLTEIPVEEEEFSPPLSFEELEPDEQHFHEATGNEGASFERSYHRAALILWPSEQVLAVINQAGLRVTLPFLEDLTQRCTTCNDAVILDQAKRLSRHMATDWRLDNWYPRQDDQRTEAGHFLALLVRLKDTATLETFLVSLIDRRGFDVGDAGAIADALLFLPPDRAGLLAGSLVEGAVDAALAACGVLLVRLSERDRKLAVIVARLLVAALPGDVAGKAKPWRTGPGVRPGFVVDLFTALGRIDPTLAAISADHVLDSPAAYGFDKIVIPATQTLLAGSETAGQTAVRRLCDACIAHLDARIAIPLEAPTDWKRDSDLGCKCADCRMLAGYLAGPALKDWSFSAAEPRRNHLESVIRSANCDLTVTTARLRRPYSLVCTKTQASYRRRYVQRASDLAMRQALSA